MSSLVQLKSRRDPARPGPGPMPDALLRALDVDVKRRIDGLLAGEYRAAMLGRGTELAQIRRYEPGDDVREIDWNVTARTGQPHIRVRVAERVLTTWLVLDVSPSMTFGTADRRKADVAEGVALAVGHLATRRGNRLGVVTVGGARSRIIPPTQGRVGMMALLTELRRESHSHEGVELSLHRTLQRAAGMFRSRAAVFVVSDFMGPLEWRSSLIRLAARHDIAGIEIHDPREHELVDVGEIWFIDPESGTRVRVDTSDRLLRQRFKRATADRRAEVIRVLRSSGANHVALSTSGDWLRNLASFLVRRGSRP